VTSDEGAAVIDAPGAPSVPDILVRVEHVAKAFGPTQALRDCSFELRAGEVHALAG
jgi:ABC-type sugar transport system ATPase subunit